MFSFLSKDKNFDSAVSVVLKHEGGYTNNPSDPGGPTDFGISLRFLRAAGIDGDGNRSTHVTIADIKSLTPNKAKNIYYKFYWKKNNFNKVNSLRIATSLLDMNVLMGNEAILLMQRALNEPRQIVKEDAIMGPETLNAINNFNPSELNDDFKKECKSYFDLICLKNPKLGIFKKGWYNRVDDL